MEKNREKKITDALKKVAFGFCLEEVTEEFSVEDGEMKLTRRKETHKDVPPDLKAVRMLLDGETSNVSEMSDEQLENEKQRLLKLLKENET